MKTLDCRGQQCPQPVVQTRQCMLAATDQPVCVLVDDPIARDNISRLAEKQGYIVNVSSKQGVFQLELTPSIGTQPETKEIAAAGPTIVYIGSDQMGYGDQKLGQLLMKNFIFTLVEGDRHPDAIYFVNTGVKLVVGGSDVLEPLENLACAGVDIASCGLCLDFFELKDALAVGRISNMLELVNALGSAGRIVRP